MAARLSKGKRKPYFEGFKVAIPRHLIGDLHEWSNETATVPICCPVNTQPRERAWIGWRGEKTPLSSALARCSGAVPAAEVVGSASASERPTRSGRPRLPLPQLVGGEGTASGEMLGWGGTPTRLQRRRPKVGSARMETSRRA